MLVSTRSDCCCPEMRCCTPETVTATISGMSGITVIQNGHWGGWDVASRCPELVPEVDECSFRCGGNGPMGGFVHSLHDAIGLEGNATGRVGGMGFLSDDGVGFCYDAAGKNWWPPTQFPPRMAILREPGDCTPGPGMYPEDPPITCETLFQYAGEFVANGYPWTDLYIVRWEFYRTELCNSLLGGNPLFCSRPLSSGDMHAGPCSSGIQKKMMNENDLNGMYVCHRPENYQRPEVKCRIIRQNPLAADSPYNGATEARLLYDVSPRRVWNYRYDTVPPPNDCWDVLFPPSGDDYCIDYRCGKRNPWYSASGMTYCQRGKCTTTNQGVVKPHLYPYHQSGNQSAELYLRLIPKTYQQDIDGRFPLYWRVGAVDVLDGGLGYSVGQFFEVRYEFPPRRRLLGGEDYELFPIIDSTCAIPYYPTWTDKYGYGGERLDAYGGWRLFQRLRVSEVDANGAIKSIEVVPIYKYAEYADPPLCTLALTGDAKTKFYTGYGRVICHPTSVHFPGVGYTVGDRIEFYCDDPPCEVLTAAIAEVVDVDDEGGILDWRVRGTDFTFYATQNVCRETNAASQCVAYCTTEGEVDQRGKYRWKTKYLCDLTWVGVGVPVRAASTTGAILNGFCGDSYFQNAENISGYTNITIRISRRNCETSIETFVFPWPFDSYAGVSGGWERAAYLFPSFPRCAGGGAIIRPEFGPWAGNESDFGSYLAGAQVITGGGGYCFRDKRHVAPTLPTVIPAIGGGFGATISGFSFTSVNNFPNPAITYPGAQPESNRFSYFPVTAATVGNAGLGYQVGQEFDVAPSGGKEVTDMWRATGGDSPEECPDGAWYGGERANVNAGGYLSVLFDYEVGQYLEQVNVKPSKCRLRVSSVNASGGITGLQVVNGGMMFRTEWTTGKLNPTVTVNVNSTLGYGAYISSSFNQDYSSATFGKLTSVSVVAAPAGVADPRHPNQPMPTGGRDYADQKAGYFWMLNDTEVGGPVCERWRLLAHFGWHSRPFYGDIGPEPTVPYNPFHDEYSTHSLVKGSNPQFIPRSTVCAFSDCYHDLLTRTYPLIKAWGGGCGPGKVGPPFWDWGAPTTSYAMYLKKGKTVAICNQYTGPQTGRGEDYFVYEYGPTLALGYTPSNQCPDYYDGSTSDRREE